MIAGSVVFFHHESGAAVAEVGSHPDEAAHFVTGLMVRDYLVSGFHESPLKYGDDYYRHYPKIGLGNWPPLFYVVQALWTLMCGPSVAAVLRLMEVLGIAVAMLTGLWLWREYGWIEAGAGAVLLTALPLVQQYTNMVMAEMLCALLMFGAAGLFARFLESGEGRWAVWFGICAALAIMAKGTGLALVLVPVFGILFTGRWELLKRGGLWMGAVAAAIIAGPWTWHFRNTGRGGWEEARPSAHFTGMAVGYYGREMCVALGWLLAALAVTGAVVTLMPEGRKRGIAVCSLALVLGVWIFQSITPVGLEARHLTAVMPALMVLAMGGMNAITKGKMVMKAAAAAFLLIVFFVWPAVFHPAGPTPGYGSLGRDVAVSPFRIPQKEWSGFKPAAEAIIAAGPGKPVLVASDARGEGMLIAEVAARDPHRPSFTVERASKLLAESTWSGSGYQQFYNTTDEVSAALAKAGIGTVVMDSSPENLPPHDVLLMETIGTQSGFALMQRSDAVRDGKVTAGAIWLCRMEAAH